MRQQRSRISKHWRAALLFGAVLIGSAWLVLGRSRRSEALRPDRSSARLRDSILGADKHIVQSVFGPPKAAAGMAFIPPDGRQAYWEADIWYYSINPARKTAMAIRFENGVARKVDFVYA